MALRYLDVFSGASDMVQLARSHLNPMYTVEGVGKSTGNLQVSGAIPIPNLPKNLYLHGGYRFSNRYAAGDLYLYLHRFTRRYEQMESTCQRARIHSQMVILCVYTRLRACARESGEVALVIRERARARSSSRG